MSIYKIRVRRDTSGKWTFVNPVLGIGEVGFETDTRKLKVGDGTTPWNSLNYVAYEVSAHNQAISTITGLQAALDNKAALSHSHAISDVATLQTALDGKAALSHSHAFIDVTGLQAALDNKSNIGHAHAISDVTSLQGALDLKAAYDHTHTYEQVTATGFGREVIFNTSGLFDASPEFQYDRTTSHLIVAGTIESSGIMTAREFYGDLLGSVHAPVKNTSGGAIGKGVPVYITGTVGATTTLEVAIARADDSSKMPALGILVQELSSNATGHVAILGTTTNINTSAFSVGQTVYVGPTGGLVNTRPTGVAILVQNIGKVGRVNSNNGEIIVTGPGRTNDVPNNLSLDSLYDVETSGVASGQALIYNGSIWSYGSAGSAGGGFTSSGAAPSTGSLAQGYRWFDTENAIEFTLVDDGDSMQWVELPSNGLAASTGTGGGGGGSAGTKTYAVFTPFNNQPPNSSFATADTRNSILVLDFDDSSDESAVFVGVMPEGAVLTSGLKVRIHWMASTATSGTCRWGAQIERMNTDLNSDSFDTAATAGSATNGTSGIITVTEITVTNIDGLQEGEPFRLKVYRDADGTSGTDDMTGDAELVVVEVRSAA